MESYVKPPEALSLIGNVSENWRRFWQRFDLFMKATDLDTRDESKKIAVFLNIIGDDGLELFNSFTLSDTESQSLTAIKLKFEEYCSPKKNIIFERFKFNSIVQKEGQSFDNFLTELHKGVKTTEYKDQEEMVRDRIVMGVYNKTTQERLLRESSLSLTKAIDFCRAVEISKEQAKQLQAECEVTAIRRERPKSEKSYETRKENQCSYCGYKHIKGKCPAYGKKCSECQGKNHFAAVCKRKKKIKKNVNEIQQEEEDEEKSSEEEEVYIDNVEMKIVGSLNKARAAELMWSETINVEGQEVLFKLDTGAEVNVLTYETVHRLGLGKNIRKTNVTLVSYGSTDFKVKPVGEISLSCSIKEKSAILPFIIIRCKNQISLLGLQACVELNLIKRIDGCSKLFKNLEQVVLEYPDVFAGLGQYPKTHTIILKEDAIPHVQVAKRVPQALYSRLKDKLKDLEQQGIIQKIDKPTDWLHPLVIVEKPNKDLRLCLNPKYLNNAIKREHFTIPTADEIASKLHNKAYFSVLDMKDGYFQIRIDQQSADYCTFGTPFGRYQFLRLPFGISSAPEVFQKINYEIFGDIDGVQVYFDDLIISGTTELEHDMNIRKVLDRAVKYNIKFNKSKVQFKSQKVKFMGQYFSSRGIEPSQTHIKAIVDMPKPQCKSDVLRLLGMAKFLGKHIPNMSKITSPLRNLTRQDVEFIWTTEHDNALKQVKHLLTNAPVLSFFNPTEQIEIETDASKDGLGACLLQNGHPIAFASRSLNKQEIKYAQIEKEMNAIVFACNKFHYYIYGIRNVTLHTDHKPLEAIFKKDIQTVSPRLQRMLMKVQNYDISVKYKPGKYLYIADTLSRAFLNNEETPYSNIDYAVHAFMNYLPMSNERKNQIKQETQNDEQLQTIIQFTQKGWPKKQKIPKNVKHYYKLKNDIYICDDILFLENKLIVPEALRKQMLEKLHEGHMSIEKTKNRARQIFYWPRLAADIEDFIKKCKICERYARKNCKETLKPYELPNRPWERVGADIFSYGNNSYLVMMDAYSNWLELRSLRNKSAIEIVSKLKSIFSKFGCPDTLICDNVPFNSFPMKQFAIDWNFEIVTRSPNYPRSNGLAEKAVGIAKNIVKKALEEGKDVYESLMQYRNSPLKYIGYSPAQILMSRICKTKVPISVDLLKPVLCENVKDKLAMRQSQNTKRYNQNTKNLVELRPNENVTIYNHVNKTWEPGQIIDRHNTPRSYIVRDKTGNSLRRNRLDLRKSLNEYKPENICEFNEAYEECNNFKTNIPSNSEPNKTPNVIKTKSGRIVKKPIKLDL